MSEEAYRNHYDGLLKHARVRVSDWDVAEDLVQDTFLKFHSYLNKEIRNPRALLFKILKNAIIDYYRKGKTESLDKLMEYRDEDGEHLDFPYEEEKDEFDSFDKAKLAKALLYLTQEHQDILRLRYQEELLPVEIAVTLGRSRNVISTGLHRAKKRLFAILKPCIPV